jgi:pimeloyl-ACP methyl ester carboxylesterase
VRYEPDKRDRYIAMLRRGGVDAMWPEIDATVGARARELGRRQSIEDAVRGVRVFHTRPDAVGVLRDFRGRVLVIRGEHDTVGPPERVFEMAASARDGCAHVVAGAGHYVNLDQPAAFNAILRTVAA